MTDRFYDYGAVLTQRGVKGAALAGFTPGLYQGFDPTILGPNQLSLGVGSLLFPHGIFWAPTTTVTTPGFPVTVLPGSYTLLARHDDIQAIGGSQVVLSWETGILDEVTDGVALLYVRQDVAGPLLPEQLRTPTRLLELVASMRTRDRVIPAPFNTFNLVKGSNIILSNTSAVSGAQYLSHRFQNTALVGIQVADFDVMVPPEVTDLRSMALQVEIPSLGSIAVTATTQDGTVLAPTSGSPLVGPLADVTVEHDFLFDQNTSPIALLHLTVSVPALTSAYLHRMHLRP